MQNLIGKKKLVETYSQYGIDFLQNELLSRHTSIKIGGVTQIFALPKNFKQLRLCVSIAQKKGIKFCILGNGTNTLFSDEGFDGVVICTKRLNKIKVQKDGLLALCGVNLFDLCNFCKQNCLAGVEFLKGIPGSVGGAMQTNAGAFGGAIGDFVEYVIVYDPFFDRIEKLSKSDLCFGYRTSALEDSQKVVFAAKLVLKVGEKSQIESLQNQFFQKKLATQPYDKLSLGSTFKRNPNFPPISKIIDELGLKGYSVGGASVSKKHAGFLTNNAKATCQDYLLLIKYIQQKVFEKYGFVPQLEIKHKE